MDNTRKINEAIVSHGKMKERLKLAIGGDGADLKPAVVSADDQCEFGVWLHQQAPPEVRRSAAYQNVLKLHASFHRESGRVLELALSGQREQAERAMSAAGEWGRAAASLLAALNVWREGETRASADPATAAAEKTRAVLAERARALIQSTEIQTGETMQLVAFSLASEKYGISAEFVREVQPLREVTPVPCTPDFVVGVINVRGSIYSVIDIRGFFGVPKREITETTKVILVGAAGLEVGILADDVSGATNILLSDIKPPLAAQTASKDEYVLGITPKMLIILNLEALLRDERIIVHQEVG